MHGYELDGFDSQILRNIATKEECQAACLRTLNSQCRSAEFVPRERVCRMSSENRRTQLRSFRATSPEIIYMENQCAGGNQEADNFLSNCTQNNFQRSAALRILGSNWASISLVRPCSCPGFTTKPWDDISRVPSDVRRRKRFSL